MSILLESPPEATEAIQVSAPITSFTGLPDVDAYLLPHLASSPLILAAGMMGGGKSLLCCQVAANLIRQGLNVTMLSTELNKHEVVERMMSCHAKWDYNMLKDGRLKVEEAGELFIPHDGSKSPEFTRLALPLAKGMQDRFSFHHRQDFRTNPQDVLCEVLAQDEPDCLIVDALYLSPLIQDGDGVPLEVNMVSLAEVVMKFLGGLARSYGIPVLVTCQKHPEEIDRVRKRVEVEQISEFPSIGKLCDVFIGISHLRAGSEDSERGCYSPSQFLNIITKSGTRLFPVLANFGMQCFEHRDEGKDDPACNERASAMRAQSQHKGYVLFRREVFEQLCDLGNPNCINLYALLLLLVDWNRNSKRYGQAGYGREKLMELSGLSAKMVRNAMRRLLKAGLIRDTGKKLRRAKVIEIVDFRASQDSGNPGYLMLARNLRDPQRRGLLGDPIGFRVWLGLIQEARFSTDMEGLERGQLPKDLSDLAQRIGEDVTTLHDKVEAFLLDGRVVEEWNDSYDGIVLRVANYDIYQKGDSYQRKNAARFAENRELEVDDMGQ